MNSSDFARSIWLQIVSPLALHPPNWYLHSQCTTGVFCWQFSGPLICLCQTSWAQNHNQITPLEQSLMGSHFRLLQLTCWCLLTCIVCESIHIQFCWWPIDFCEEWAEQHKHDRVIREVFNDYLFFLIIHWAELLWGHIISFVIIPNQILSFDSHSTMNLLWHWTFRRDYKALTGCIICESITEFIWDQIYQFLLGWCWKQVHVLWWQLPVQWELIWSWKGTNSCVSSDRPDAIWR